MKISWIIDKTDIEKLRNFYIEHKNNTFVKTREKRNIQKQGIDLSREFFWKSMVICLLTTQQRAGPESKISKFIRQVPFPLDLKTCVKKKDLTKYIQQTLTEFGGIRRTKRIAEELKYNIELLNSTNWQTQELTKKDFLEIDDKHYERGFAERIEREFKGFGPKQARNFIQILGLSKYEIPLDSRITKWLNEFGFPLKLSSVGLSDRNYYEFILDGFQELCDKGDIYPCLLDAAIFSSFDKDEWTNENSFF